MSLIRVGTCAWSDHEDYYPPGLPANQRLSYYARHFSVVEVDSTFYRLQPARWFAAWADRTPPDFVFNVKVYGAMTRHHREPRSGEEDLAEVFRRFDASVEPLRSAGKLRALHFQFPPWFVCTPENRQWVAYCREQFPRDLVSVEFRHRSWFQGEAREGTLQFLRQLEAVHVICDEPQVGSGCVPRVVAVTHPALAIVRFHGRNRSTWYVRGERSADRFDYLYSKAELQEWVRPVREELEPEVDEIHLLMNNNRANYAVRNALDMMELLGLPVPPRDERGAPVVPVRGAQQLRLFE